jgi:hypothetical protein
MLQETFTNSQTGFYTGFGKMLYKLGKYYSPGTTITIKIQGYSQFNVYDSSLSMIENLQRINDNKRAVVEKIIVSGSNESAAMAEALKIINYDLIYDIIPPFWYSYN